MPQPLPHQPMIGQHAFTADRVLKQHSCCRSICQYTLQSSRWAECSLLCAVHISKSIVSSFIFTFALTMEVIGAPQMTSPPISSIFLFSTALWDLADSRPVHSLMLSSHLFFCLPCHWLPCEMVLARPDDQETCPYHFHSITACSDIVTITA